MLKQGVSHCMLTLHSFTAHRIAANTKVAKSTSTKADISREQTKDQTYILHIGIVWVVMHELLFFFHFVWHILQRVLRQDKTKTCASERAHSDSTPWSGAAWSGSVSVTTRQHQTQSRFMAPRRRNLTYWRLWTGKKKMCSLILALGVIGYLPESW